MDDRTFDKQTADDWIKAVETTERSFRDDHIYPKINDLIHQSLPKRILDIGCGQGVCSDKIDLKHSEYTGVEPSTFLLDRAKQLYLQPNIFFYWEALTLCHFLTTVLKSCFQSWYGIC